MPKGYPDTQTCQNCGEGCPADWAYCPTCGNKFPPPSETQTIKKEDVGRIEDLFQL